MPAPLARGLIITVTVLVAAGLAAYDSPQIREWLERTRQKIVMGISNLEHDIDPKRKYLPRSDRSMVEEKGEMAEQRRARAIADIIERGRVMEERRKRRKMDKQAETKPQSPSFDTLVDQSGSLRPEPSLIPKDLLQEGNSTAVETKPATTEMRSRQPVIDKEDDMQRSVDGGLSIRQLQSDVPPLVQLEDPFASEAPLEDPFESQYERELRQSWNLSIQSGAVRALSSHESESLIDFTPVTEDIPDPDISVPSADVMSLSETQSDYFSVSRPYTSNSQTRNRNLETSTVTPGPSDTISHIHDSEAMDSEDDSSIFGDGVQTPASAWTEVGSTVSGSS